MQDNLPFSTEVINSVIVRCQLMLHSSEEKNSTETDGESVRSRQQQLHRVMAVLRSTDRAHLASTHARAGSQLHGAG